MRGSTVEKSIKVSKGLGFKGFKIAVIVLCLLQNDERKSFVSRFDNTLRKLR